MHLDDNVSKVVRMSPNCIEYDKGMDFKSKKDFIDLGALVQTAALRRI